MEENHVLPFPFIDAELHFPSLSDRVRESIRNTIWAGCCRTSEDFIFVCRHLYPERLRLRIDPRNCEQQDLFSTAVQDPTFYAPKLRALYLRGIQSIGPLVQALRKQKETGKNIFPCLEELDLSFNTRTIFGESVISNLLPFLQHDSQLRILRLKACEANYDIARSIRNGVDTLLMCNNTLVILDIAENRCLPVKIPETNSTILNLGASSETHANAANLLRNKNLYEERVFIKKVLRYKFGRNEELITHICRFLIPNYSLNAYNCSLHCLLTGGKQKQALRYRDKLYPSVFQLEQKDKPETQSQESQEAAQRFMDLRFAELEKTANLRLRLRQEKSDVNQTMEDEAIARALLD